VCVHAGGSEAGNDSNDASSTSSLGSGRFSGARRGPAASGVGRGAFGPAVPSPGAGGSVSALVGEGRSEGVGSWGSAIVRPRSRVPE